MSIPLPKLTEAQVKNYIYGQYFDRGQDYFQRGQVFGPIRRGNMLEARCEGSLPSPYRVRATLGPRPDGAEGILSTDCSCPVGGGCKHAAALLLMWVHHPERFSELETMDALLEKRSKHELIVLVKEMIKRDPDLETLLDLPLPGTKPKGERIDPEPYRRQVRNAFRGAEDWEDSFGVSSEISSVNDMADQFAQAEDWDNAQIVYQAVIDEGLANYENAVHDEGEVISEIDRAAEGLAACLPALENDPLAREAVIRALFDVIRWDTNMGGYGAGDEIPGMLFEHATLEERQSIREWIMTEAAGANVSEPYTGKWRKEHWARLLLQLDEQEGDVEGFLVRARALGMYRALFEKLVTLNRVEEAVEIATVQLRDSELEFLNSALTLEKAGYTEEAFRMVQRDAAKLQDSRLLAWLAEKYEVKGDLLATLNLQLRRWETGATIADYKNLERLARALHQWDALHPKLLAGLETKPQNLPVLAQVHLYEQDWDAAWEVADRKPAGYWSLTGIREEVAQATETHRPQRAVQFYLSRVEAKIAERNRGSYAEAAVYLQRVKRISKETGQMGAWMQTIQAIRDKHKNLPALKDELNKAKL